MWLLLARHAIIQNATETPVPERSNSVGILGVSGEAKISSKSMNASILVTFECAVWIWRRVFWWVLGERHRSL
jgi:hypothetical protein